MGKYVSLTEQVVLLGAGSAMFTKGLVADVIKQRWGGEIRLVDVDAHALETAIGLAKAMVDISGADIVIRGSTDRREMLPESTAVICTVGVGGRRAWEQDVLIPRAFGIFQPVGDTVMPGGSSRALRMIPPMVEIARDVLELSPQALFFNYGNPMSPVCRAIRKATGAPVIGLCHGVNSVAAYLAKALDVEVKKLKYTAAGINHLTWFTDLSVDGNDLGPALGSKAQRISDQIREGLAKSDKRIFQSIDNPVSWELTNLTGAFPAVLDRHVTEFFPAMYGSQGAYYGKTLGVDIYNFEDVIKSGDDIFADMQRTARGDSELPPDLLSSTSGEHEQVTDIIESIRKNDGRTYSANIPNQGQITGLPAESIIECPCVAGQDGLIPRGSLKLPAVVIGTLATRFLWVETIVEAALEGCMRKFAQALLIDGSVKDIGMAWELAETLVNAHKKHLHNFG